jgi:hypothetical protein
MQAARAQRWRASHPTYSTKKESGQSWSLFSVAAMPKREYEKKHL